MDRQCKLNFSSDFICLLMALLAILITVSCSTPAKHFDTRFNLLQIGMSIAQAQDLLGPPDFREANFQTELWHFRREEPRFVRFERGKIISFGAEAAPAVLVPQPTAPVADSSPLPEVLTNQNMSPRSIGEACKTDSDCQTKNCHFRICSGPDNCQVPDGKICATDHDCCSHFCDFGSCRKKLK